jgi:hypothetical protein
MMTGTLPTELGALTSSLAVLYAASSVPPRRVRRGRRRFARIVVG